MKTFKNYLLEEEQANETPSVGDVFEIEMARDETLIETTVVEVLEDGIVINADDAVMKMFEDAGYLQEYKTDGPVPSGGSKSPVGSVYKKVNTQQSTKDALAEDDTYTDKQIKMAFGIINDPRFKGGNMTEIVRRIEGIADGLSDHPSVMRAIERTNVGENAQLAEGKIKELLGDVSELTNDEFKAKYNMSKDEAREKFDIEDEQELDEMSAMRRLAGIMKDKENIKNTRIPSHDERRIQVDLIDLSDEEFEAKHKMSKAQAREKFNEAHDASAEEDAFNELKDNEGAMKDNFTIDDIKSLERIRDLETLKARAKELIKGRPAKRMKPEKIAFFYNRVDSLKSPMAIIKMMYDLLLAGEGHKVVGSKNSMAPNVYRQRFGEAHDANAEEDAFKELKDYAETSGGIDKEEFEKAAYLVKAMGKPHLKDKAEGMLDDLIGKMDSDPRDKVIQVLARHIDLTFLKNLFKSAETDLDEKYDSDKFFDGKGTPEQRTQLLKLQNKALRAFPSSPKQKEIKKEIDALRKKMGMKVKEEVELDEAEYQGRKVKLNKPTRGDVKKFKVYVKDPKTGNVKKVNFGHGGTSAKKAGQKTMSIKKSNPARRKSFRARHNCDNPGPKTKARYWSCRAW